MVSRLSNVLSRSRDEDDDFIQVAVKKEFVEEKNKHTMKDESSQTINKSKLQSCKRKRVTSHSAGKVKLEREVFSPAMVQAHRVQTSLGTKSPSFIILLFKSHVDGSGTVHLPYPFCSLHLPKDETMITLEDENEENSEVKYLSKCMGFSAGWKKFAMGHKLHERDVLIFHLVEPTKFKVYIIRDDDQVNVNPSLLEENEQGVPESSDPTDPSQDLRLRTFKEFKFKHVKPLSAGKVKLEREVISSPAMVQANRIQLTKSLSFIKLMSKSNVNRSCSLHLSVPFCSLHLPKDETMITLEDENEDKFEVKYIPKWWGLSAGWKNFAVAHKLRERDVLLFHLVIKPTKFKVYIIRADDHINLNPSLLEQNEQGHSESSDYTEPSKDLPTFEEFQLKIHSLCLESELDENTLKKYYELCCCKNDILHNKILRGLNSKLVAGIIGQTVNIADAVKACNIFTPREKLEQWENSLKSFKLLGMKVEFLVNRVSQLLKLGVEYEGTRFENEMKNLEVKRLELKEAYEKVGVVFEKLKLKAEMHKVKFQQVIDSPW